MNSRTKLNKGKHSIEENIVSILKKAPKRGIWMKNLAIQLDVSRPLLNYYLYGMKKRGIIIRGKFRDKILIRKEGNNKFIRLKVLEDSNV